jgi:hypothetical protein
MRYLRSAVLAAVVAVVLLVPATAIAQITSVSLTGGQLGAQGASVSLQVTVQCDPAWNFAFADASVVQATGHKLAQGTGSFFSSYPGVPCGTPANLTVNDSSPFAFKKGRASATATVTVFNPSTFEFADQTVTQDIRITKK